MKRMIICVLAIGALAGATTAARAESFGAIAYSPDTGATGWSHDYRNRRSAEGEAMGNCFSRANDCRVAIWFKNACGAVARGAGGGWGSGWGGGRREAEYQAIRVCERNARRCEVVRWQCSGAR